jgi:hypothetical protein
MKNRIHGTLISFGKSCPPRGGRGAPVLKVYEMVDHLAARAGHLLVRGGVHQIAYARAVELLTGADLSKLFPTPSPRTRSAGPRSTSTRACTRSFTGSRPTTTARSRRCSGARIRRPARSPWSRTGRRRARCHATCGRSPRCSHPTTRRRDRRDRPEAAQGRRVPRRAQRPRWPTAARASRRRRRASAGARLRRLRTRATAAGRRPPRRAAAWARRRLGAGLRAARRVPRWSGSAVPSRVPRGRGSCP